MSLEMSLIELYNPLYLLPIVGVVFCALLVYAFGFKSTTLPPNFHDLDDNKKITTKKKKVEKSLKSTTGKTQQNGHINTGAVKVQEKKTVQKKETKSPVAETKASSVSNDKVVNSNKVTAKKDKTKNKKNEPNVDTQDLDDKDSGEWVELISKKERKSRKQKEEQMLNELQETSLATNVKTKSSTSPKKQSKKGKENKEKTEKSPDSKVGKAKNTDSKNKESGVNVQNDKNAKQQSAKEEDLIVEDPDIYELVKEQRSSKKLQKHRKDKRNSESEVAPKLESLVESETNVNQTDKLTASIVANYEAADQNKPDSLSTANNKKKKDKSKKKQPQTSLNNATNNKQVIENDNKPAPTPVKETPVHKPDNAVNIPNNTNDVKPSDDDDFKVTVSKKRRARRE